MTLALALGFGIAWGVFTGIPLGVINVAIIEAASGGRRRFAIGLGLGGALADSLHAGLAFVGVGQLVIARPDLVRVLAIAAAVLIVGYVLLTWRRRKPAQIAIDSSPLHGATTGFLLTGPNPGALAAWVATAAALWPGANLDEAIAIALGVGVGSAAWFTVLARFVSRLPPDHKALRIIPRVALVLLVGVAVFGVVRVV